MTENIAEPIQEKKLQELVVYHLVDSDFIFGNIYALGGVQPNARHIAQQYDCDLEFRDAEYRDHPNTITNTKFLAVDEQGRGTAAVLVGESRERLARARDDIVRTFGSSPLNGKVSVGGEKDLF